MKDTTASCYWHERAGLIPADLFGRAGLRPGMKCIDVGCGGGEVTLAMARLVEPGGFVTGVDMDEVKLDLARKAAVERGVTNVEFLEEMSTAGTSRTPMTWCIRGFSSSI